MMKAVKEFTQDKLAVHIYATREDMGQSAAADVAKAIFSLLEKKEEINMIFGAAPSQNELLASLCANLDIPWDRINAFHMDEYLGLDKDAPQGFGNFLKRAIFANVPFRSVNYLNGQTSDPQGECARYTSLFEKFPPDIVCLGIGENGHIAFNDPHVADFHDPAKVKVVDLDNVCRQQQVNDGCFSSLSEVPKNALTVTIPQLVSAPYLFCVVPAPTKANAVFHTVKGEISEACPASILRTRDNAQLYLDMDSSALL